MKADQERVSKLLTDTVTLLCKNGLVYSQEIRVQGLLGITLDKNDVFIVHINEVIGDSAFPASRESVATTTTSNASITESNRRKNASSSMAVVDLTRAVDTPLPLPVVYQHQQATVTSPVSAGRKQRSVPMAAPHPQLVASQHMAQRIAYSPRPIARRNPNTMQQQQQAYNSQMAATYLAQLQQQVSRGMMRMPPPLRQRTVSNSRRSQPVPASVPPPPTATVLGPSGVDDDEDVVIIGTGHEEPSPNWNSPSRRHPMSSRASVSTPTSTTPAATVSQPKSLQCSRSNVHQPQQSFHTASIASNVECTSQPLSEASSRCIEVMAEDNKILVQPAEPLSSDAQLLNTGGEAEAIQSVDKDKDGSEAVKEKAIAGDELATFVTEVPQGIPAEQSHQHEPFVYTDIADVSCDMEELAKSESLMEIEIPGFDILTSDDQRLESRSQNLPETFSCHVADCLLSFREANELANHYVVVHSRCMDLETRPTVIEPTSDTNDATDTASTNTQQPAVAPALSSTSSLGLTCPFASCGLKLSSYPGLLMHHKRQHGTPLPSNVRQVIMATRRAIRKSSQHSNNNFVCLVSECGTSCPSREELIDHLRSVHPAMVSSVAADTSSVPLVCKEENIDDKT